MNRPIEFRGMDISGNWHYGFLSIIPNDTNQVKAGYYISNKAGMPFAYNVRPETVGQFTGLYDSKEMKIFEGDIVEYNNSIEGGIAKIEAAMGKQNLYFVWISQKTKGPSIMSHTDYFGCSSELEVIGNIYEHPALLEYI